MNWPCAPIMTDTETYIVHFTQLIELAVARGASSTCIVCGVDFTMEASALPPPLLVGDIEMNKANGYEGEGEDWPKSYDVITFCVNRFSGLF